MKNLPKSIFLTVLFFTATAILFGCDSPGHGRSLEELGEMSQADSMFYYYGRIRASDYIQQSLNDTMLQGDKAEERYLKGVLDGLKEIDEDDSVYNEGLMDGVQMGMMMKRFYKEYGVHLNRDILMHSLAYALRSDTILNAEADQAMFYSLLAEVANDKTQRVHSVARQKLVSFSSKAKMHRIQPELFGKTVNVGHGSLLANGTRLMVDVDVCDSNGRDLGMTLPEEMTVGDENIPQSFSSALSTMRLGEEKHFATPALSLFGRRSNQMGLDPTDVVILKIKVLRQLPPVK